VFKGGRAPASHATDRWFFAASGSDHVDLNQAALFGEASAGDAAELAGRVTAAGVPCLLACSDGVVQRVAPALGTAGFLPLPTREALFHPPG
jgi:hypothetical protein